MFIDSFIHRYTCTQWNRVQWNCIQDKISPNNGILFNDVLRSKLLKFSLPFCFLMSLDFLLSHITHFDNVALLLLVFITLGFILSVFFYTKMTFF